MSVGKLVGIKTFINEFVAYKELGDIINFRKNLIENQTYELYKNGTLSIPSNIAMIWNVIIFLMPYIIKKICFQSSRFYFFFKF